MSTTTIDELDRQMDEIESAKERLDNEYKALAAQRNKLADAEAVKYEAGTVWLGVKRDAFFLLQTLGRDALMPWSARCFDGEHIHSPGYCHAPQAAAEGLEFVARSIGDYVESVVARRQAERDAAQPADMTPHPEFPKPEEVRPYPKVGQVWRFDATGAPFYVHDCAPGKEPWDNKALGALLDALGIAGGTSVGEKHVWARSTFLANSLAEYEAQQAAKPVEASA